MSGPAAVHPLRDNQLAAVDPEESVWLSASAGTGKTQVLSSRVLRLLLEPNVRPSQILCLTFTKAGATEMAARINDTLAQWVRLGDTDLALRLDAIGAPSGPAVRERARTLFASVLDCPGGGLRIDTIHAFSQWLLATFPEEAGLTPGTRPMEDRERLLLARQVLADLLAAAESDPLGDPALLGAVAALSLRNGADEVERFVLRCASVREVWFGSGSWQSADMRRHVLRLLGLPENADADMLAALCADDVFAVASLRHCLAVNRDWGTKGGTQFAECVGTWLAGSPQDRAADIDLLAGQLLTGKGEPRKTTSQEKLDPSYAASAERVIESIRAVRELAAMLALVDRLVPALRLGRAFALAWDEAKRREGLIDFDDQIRTAARLLENSEQADWIRYKLDRQFDHILVDEAQDTNAAQWRIIFAMAQEFWAGLGQHEDIMRTLFVVGDYKQAIFRFQGTSPEYFARAADSVRASMDGAASNAAQQRANLPARKLQEFGLGRSFRTASPVLEFVDATIARIGHEGFGLDRPAEPHVGQDRPGYVALWRPVPHVPDADDDEGVEDGDEGAPQTWLSRSDRRMAEGIARQVALWLDESGPGFALHKGETRRAEAGDIMVLVRKRADLAALIVGQLYRAGVPVAGVDRLRLGAPLAVRDLVAALRFAAQPLDDLNLAALLVSPLVGWSQEQLLEYGWRGEGVRLWDHFRAGSASPEVAAVLDRLGALLALADYQSPAALLHWLLTGPWEGRRRLVARLGSEANDPIDELVNAAFSYAVTDTPSLTGFLAWFDASEGEIKREADQAKGLVRVMTAHGSKGLQAPIVILADAAGNPDRSRETALDLADPRDPERVIPLPPLAKEEKAGRIAEALAANRLAEQQEHWRLLYVAMTRAEEALFIGGALGRSDKDGPAPGSWYARLAEVFGDAAQVPDPVWGDRREWGAPPVGLAPRIAAPQLPLENPLPIWLERPPAAEPRPPKPLAPSSLGEADDAPDPPFPPGAGQDAARRGTLIHRLLERLPDVAPASREKAAEAWLARNAAGFSAEERRAMLGDALAVTNSVDWAQLFGPDSLAEVPIAAVVAGQVVAGVVDRLVVTDNRVRFIDYKTARRAPATIDEVPRAIVRQMAAYAAALEVIFPGRTVEAALLYTGVPRLIAVAAEELDRYKSALGSAE